MKMKPVILGLALATFPLGQSRYAWSEPVNPTPATTTTRATTTANQGDRVCEYIYLYYFDNPIRLIEAISQQTATKVREIANTPAQAKTGLSPASNLALDRAKVDRLREEVRRYEAAVAPLAARKDRLLEQKEELIREQLRPAAAEEERRKTDLEEAQARFKVDPDNRDVLDIQQARERELAKATVKRVQATKLIEDVEADITAIDGQVTTLEKHIGTTRATITNTTRGEITKAAQKVLASDLAFEADLNDRVKKFASERDLGLMYKASKDEVTLLALPDQRSVLLVGPSDKVATCREMVQELDRPMSQTMVHLWSLQYSSHASPDGNESSQQALDRIDEALRRCRIESQLNVRDLFDAYTDTLAKECAKCPQSSSLLEEEGFWTRLGIYDHECLVTMGIDLTKYATDLESEYPLARICVPDPGKVSNLSELVAVLVMANDEFQQEFCERLDQIQRPRWEAAESVRHPAPEDRQPYKSQFQSVWETLELGPNKEAARHQHSFRLDLAYNFKEAADQLLITALLQRMEYVLTTSSKLAAAKNDSAVKAEGESTARSAAKADFPVMQLKAKYYELLLKKAKSLDEKNRLIGELEKVHRQLSTYRVTYPEDFVAGSADKELPKPKAPKWLAPQDQLYVYFYSEVEPLRIELRRRLAANELGDTPNGINRLASTLLQQQTPAVARSSPPPPSLRPSMAYTKQQMIQQQADVKYSQQIQMQQSVTLYKQQNTGFDGLVLSGRRSATSDQELLRSLSQFRRRLSAGGFGSSKEASTNMRLRQAMKSLEDKIADIAIEPCLLTLRSELTKDSGLEVGVFERTSLLCSNRLVSQAEARASARMELGQEQDLLESVKLLGALATDSQTGNVLEAFNRLQEERTERRSELYAINTGGVFELTPVVDPTGQGMRFRVNHVVKSIVQDPDQSSRPQLNRIEGQSVNTEVALSNFDLQEITRYRTNARLGIPERRTGGIPILRDIPGLSEVPLIGWFTRDFGESAVVQQSVILADSTVYPTLESILESLTPPYRNVLDFPSDYYDKSKRRRNLPLELPVVE